MRLVQIYVSLVLVIFVSCAELGTQDKKTTSDKLEEKQVEEVFEVEDDVVQDEEVIDGIKIENSLDPNKSQLPILPPIILLDFANDLENSSSSGDDKSKRTIDSNLGYGFGRNNLFTGKYNYYFPAGKSGTTVSIEESISPFLPKTIIENVKPITEKPYPGDIPSVYGKNPLLQNQQNNFQVSSGIQVQRPNIQVPINRAPSSQPIFGQRTKLYKPSQIDYSSYQSFSSTPKTTVDSYTTQRPDYRSNAFGANQNSYATQKPIFQSSSYNSGFSQGTYTSQRPFAGFSTPAPPLSYVTPTSSHHTRFPSNAANSYSTQRPSFDGITTARPTNTDSQSYSSGSSLAQFSNLPRFTIENGVRYENKIVWKYPDGKVSQTPPTSYINAYNEFLSKQKIGVGSSSNNYQNQATGSSFVNSGLNNYQSQSQGLGTSYQNLVPSQTSSLQNQNYQSPLVRLQNSQDTRYSTENHGNIYSKSPAQFPSDQDINKPPRISQFVSSASLPSTIYGSAAKTSQLPQPPAGQSYDLGYQGQFGQKTSLRAGFQAALNSPPSGPSSGYLGLLNDNSKTAKETYSPTNFEQQRTVPKYAVNSPNPEYTYPTPEMPLETSTQASTRLFTPSGNLSPDVLSKYSPQAQKYLTKVFSSSKSATSPSSFGENYSTTSMPDINTNYENLLNYNPSISQYISNPSSILNARPTFIQAGNSLIPVIILRVDGAPPIQPKVTPNINLKALLQQYLTQYAGNIEQNVNYESSKSGSYENLANTPSTSIGSQNPLYELTQLAQSLTQYSQDPSIASDFAKKFENTLNQNSYDSSNSFPTRTNYDSFEKTGDSDSPNKYISRPVKPQKVKSVQIIEDPRFTSYKVNN